ncbi:MAG: hypothetical protein WCY32_16080 [Burkholderiaceae bacterium]
MQIIDKKEILILARNLLDGLMNVDAPSAAANARERRGGDSEPEQEKSWER